MKLVGIQVRFRKLVVIVYMRDSSTGGCSLKFICSEVFGHSCAYAVIRIQKSKLKVHCKYVILTVRFWRLKFIVQGQFSGTFWHLSSMLSQFGTVISCFWGIGCLCFFIRAETKEEKQTHCFSPARYVSESL